jgi:CelD/BcsL family acetyltransferase involved in cellulose biosynthesis
VAYCKRYFELTEGELAFWRGTVAHNAQFQRAFKTATFCEAVAKIDDKVRVLVIYGDDKVIGLLPLRVHHAWVGRFGVYEPVAGEMTDYFGAIVSSGIVLHMPSVLKSAGIGAVIYTHLDETQAAYGLEGEEARIGLRTLIRGQGAAHWEHLRTLDKKLVADTERRERKLAAEHGDVTFELQSARPEVDLEELINLKKAQYTRTGRDDAVLFDQANASLLRGLLRSNCSECSGLLSVLRVKGKLVAAHFGLRSGGTLHFWFPVYAKEYASFSPGRILYRYVLHEGSKIGIRVIDRGEGDTQAKRDFANEEHMYHRGLWRTTGLKGLMSFGALVAYWRIDRFQKDHQISTEK